MTNEKKEWELYRDEEYATVSKILDELGFSLDADQPHIKGERFLMQAITTASGRKLILLGKRKSDNMRVVIKTTRDADGIREIEHERLCRATLQHIGFAYQIFLSPEEILFTKKDGRALSIQKFIEQEKPFLERPIEQQFELALRAFKAQESAHAATYEHTQKIKKTFGSISASGYLANFKAFKGNIISRSAHSEAISDLFSKAETLLQDNIEIIDQYDGFLTHTDFVPHNFRIVGADIYLLDHSSLRFGNKYEGWARFVNFMTLYNPKLEVALVQYVSDNRTPEESQALRLMRIYRLGEIIWYYTRTLEKSSGDLLELNTARVNFWTNALEALLAEKTLEKEIVEDYIKVRDSLRSSEEKQRQVGLH